MTSKNIPFEKAIPLLADEIDKRRLSVFVGAGCSLPAGLPTWAKLLDDLLTRYKIKTKETNLLRLASRLEKELGKTKFREEIIASLKVSPETTTPVHTALVSLNVNSYITTNYDHLLENSFRKNGVEPTTITKDEDLPCIDPTKKHIVKLHGDINSPSSLIITSGDYTKYKSNHHGFVEWLTADMSRNTILFLGTSFDDPRLSEIDDHVINLFDDMKRPHFIVLKRPDSSSMTSEEYEIALGDFEATCEDFKERDFFVITIDSYDEIEQFLNKLHEKVLGNKIKKDPSDFKNKALLQAKQIGELETTLNNLLDEKTRELCEYVNGEGRLPSRKERFSRVQKLITHLKNPPAPLSPESLTEGWITVTDAFINLQNRNNVGFVREYFEKAQLFYNDIQKNNSEWQNRLKKLQSKILFFEGEIEQAINLVADSDDPKTVYFWLALLLDSDRINEANDFIDTHGINPEWLNIALYIFVFSGKLQDAEQLFTETKEKIASLQDKEELENSPYKNKFFLEKVCFSMAEACYMMVFRLCGRETGECYLDDVSDEGIRYLSKSLFYIDLLTEEFKQGGKDSFYYIESKKIEQFASLLKQDFDRADKVALELINLSELSYNLIDFILGRKNCLTVEIDFNELSQKLTKEYPGEIWAITGAADIEAFILKSKNKAWKYVKKAAELAESIREKEHVAKVAFEICQEIEKISQAKILIEGLLPCDNLWGQFFKACFLLIEDQTESAEQIFSDLEKKELPPEIGSTIKIIQAQKLIKENKWLEARTLLEESLEIQQNLNALKDLLHTLSILQEDQKAFDIAKKLESFGRADEQVIATKAQAAYNLQLFSEAEQIYRILVKRKPLEPEYAYKLADVLLQLDDLAEALQVLQPFINCRNKNFNLQCLNMACHLYSLTGDDIAAFTLLENCFNEISNDPQLLLKHLDLCYRTGSENEKKAKKSFSRLQILKQEGKVSDDLFALKGVDDVLELLKRKRETEKEVNKQYRAGRLPRLMLCEWHNKSLYLDWAVRTQELSLDSEDPLNWVRFTIYATNGMRADLLHKRNQLVRFTLPSEAQEIIIDYHALITVHRLDLLEKLDNAFSTIYYPHILNLIWRIDQKQFKHHQPSQEAILNTINEKLELNQIRIIVAPEPKRKEDLENDTYTKRNIRLANFEEVAILDAYSDEKEFDGFKNVYRIPQIVRWLYQKGKLTETKFNELEKITKASPNIISTQTSEQLDKTSRLLVAITTLETIEQYELIKPISDLGIQLLVEKATAEYFRRAVLELRFGEKVGKWHHNLAKTIKNLTVYKTISPKHDLKNKAEKGLTESPYQQTIIDCIKATENGKLLLLTDDRMMQMAVDQRRRNISLGTDILLTHLYEKEIITIEENAYKFLQLCKWRYRFLIPDTRVLVFFAREFKTNPPGTPLQIIGNYGRDCMNDPGLFMGPETTTEPPIPMGIKFRMEWIAVWTDFLCTIWQDNDFSQESLEQFTKEFFLRSIPDFPPNIDQAVRKNFIKITQKSIITRILIFATDSDRPIKLHGLLNQVFGIFQLDERQKESEVNNFLESAILDLKLRSDESQVDDVENLRIFLAHNVLRAYYGEQAHQGTSLNLVPILKKIGIQFDNKLDVTNKHTKSQKQNFPFKKRDFFRKNMPEYIPDGPLIITKPTKNETAEILVPHISTFSPFRDERIDVLNDIKHRNDLSSYSKKLIEEHKKQLLSHDEISWQPAANEISATMLKDFIYCSSLFQQLVFLNKTDNLAQITDNAWNGVMKPDLGSVISEMPLLLRDPFENKAIINRIKEKVAETIRIEENKQVNFENILHMLFDWYLENLYFVPVAPPLNPASVIISALNTVQGKISGRLANQKLLKSVQSWLKDKFDPFAHLMAFELILYARSNAKPLEHEVFTEEKFYSEFDQLFELLLSMDDVKASASGKMIVAIWNMRKCLASYYLKYIDLHSSPNLHDGSILNNGSISHSNPFLHDDRKVALAWWMARKVCTAIVKSIEIPGTDEAANAINLKTAEIFKQQPIHMLKFSHTIDDSRENFSLGRYYTLEENSSPLTVATLAIFGTGSVANSLLKGLKEPTTILPPAIRNKIIEKLSFYAYFLGDGQLRESNKLELPFLWNVSLCTAATTLLREYYGDAIDLIGKRKYDVIEFAELISQEDFLEKELTVLPEYIQAKMSGPILITISALKAYFFSRGNLPESAEIFEKNKYLVRDIGQLDNEKSWATIFVLTQILQRLLAAKIYKWAEIFGKQIAEIDYENCGGVNLENILNSLVITVLMGHDHSVLSPLLDLKTEHADIRTNFGRIKASLEYIFPSIPLTYQENARKILNELTNIPIPNDLELNED